MTDTDELVATGRDPVPAPESPGPGLVDGLLVGWLAAVTAASALVSIFWLPWRIGAAPVPLSAVLGAAVVFVTVRLAYAVVPSMRVALLVAGAWLVPTVWLTTATTAGYGMVIGDWRAHLLLGLGALGAAVAVASCWGQHVFGRSVRTAVPDRRSRRH